MKQYLKDGRMVLELETEGRIPTLEKQSFYNDARRLLEEAQGIPAIMFSGGLDAQILVKSFMANNAQFECFFMHNVGKNTFELEYARACEKKWGFKLNVIDIDPIKDLNHYQTLFPQIDITGYFYCQYYSFSRQIPADYDLVQTTMPYAMLWQRNNKLDLIFSYYDFPSQCERVINHTANRKRYIGFPYTDSMHCGLYCNQFVNPMRNCWEYLADSFKQVKDKSFLWDHSVKPLIYSYMFGDELIYFPKRTGLENFDWGTGSVPPKHRVFMRHEEYEQLFLETSGTQIFYE